MAVDHRINRHSEVFKGIDRRSSDIQRTKEYATDIKNCSIRLSGALNKRKGFHINSNLNSFCTGITTYSNRSQSTGNVFSETIMTNNNLNKLEEKQFNLFFDHPSEIVEHSMKLDTDGGGFKYSIYNINKDEYMYGPVDLGDGLSSSDKSMLELVNDINDIRTPVIKDVNPLTQSNSRNGTITVATSLKSHPTDPSKTILDRWKEIIDLAVQRNVEANFSVIPEHRCASSGYPLTEHAYPLLFETFLSQSEINTLLIKPDEDVAPSENVVYYAYMIYQTNPSTGYTRVVRIPMSSSTKNPILTNVNSQFEFLSNIVGLGDVFTNQLSNVTFNEWHSLRAFWNGNAEQKAALMDVFENKTASANNYSSIRIKQWEMIPTAILDEESNSFQGLFNTRISETNGKSDALENTTFAELNNVLYIADGYSPIMKYDGNKVYKAGLPVFQKEFIKHILDGEDTSILYSPLEIANPTTTRNIGSNKFRYNYIFRFSYEDAKGNFITGEPSEPIEVDSLYTSYRANEYTMYSSQGNKGQVSLGSAPYLNSTGAVNLSNVYTDGWYADYNDDYSIIGDYLYVPIPRNDANLFVRGNDVEFVDSSNSFGIYEVVATKDVTAFEYDADGKWTGNYIYKYTRLQLKKGSNTGYTSITDGTTIRSVASTSNNLIETNVKDTAPNHRLVFDKEAIQDLLKLPNKQGYDVESTYSSNYVQERKGEEGKLLDIPLTGKKIQIEIFRTKMYNPGGDALEVAGQYYFVGSIPFDGNIEYDPQITMPTEFTFSDIKADELGIKSFVLVDETGTQNGTARADGNEVSYGLDVSAGADAALNPFLVFTENIKRHDPPPAGKYIKAFKNVLVISGQPTNVNNIQYSLATNFATGEIGSEYFPNDDNGIVIQSDFGDKITGIAGLRDLFYVFHKNSVHVIGGNLAEPVGIPYAVDLLTKEGGTGCLSHSSILEYQNSLVFLSERGIYSIDASNSIKELSSNIRPLFKNSLLSKQRCVAYNWVDKNSLIYSIPIEGTSSGTIYTSSSLTFVYDYANDAWLKWENIDFTAGVSEIDGRLLFMTRPDRYVSLLKIFNNTESPLDYTDHTDPIEFEYETNWESLNNPTVFKKFLRIKVFSFDNEGDFENPEGFELVGTMQTNYVEADVGQVFFNFKQFTGGGWGYFRWGMDRWGSEQSATIKSKLLRNKVKCLKIRFSNNNVNENVLLTSYELEIAAPFRSEIKE